MEWKNIPGTDLSLCPYCFGAGGIGSSFDQEKSFMLLDTYYSLGGNFLDTARVYGSKGDGLGPSASEHMIARWLKDRGLYGCVTVATKGAHYNLLTKENRVTPACIAQDVENSLKNLGQEAIDLYYLHRDNEDLPVSEIMDALFAQVEKGNIRYLGCSNWKLSRIKEACAYAARKKKTGFVISSNWWSLAKYNSGALGDDTLVEFDKGQYQYHKETNMAFAPYSSMAKGYLTKLDENRPVGDTLKRFYESPQTREIFRRTKALAMEKGVPVSAVAFAYLSCQPFPVFPVAAAGSKEQVEDLMGGANLSLTEEEIAYLMEYNL